MAERNRDLTLWQALVWVYRDQMAQRYLASPADWYLWQIATYGGLDDISRPTVHPDAAKLHAAVTAMPIEQAQLLVHFAEEQSQPHPPTVMPLPYPVRVHHGIGLGDNERWGQMPTARGGRISYMIRWLEQVSWIEPIFKRYGKKLKKVGGRREKHAVEFCPIDWQPGLAYVIANASTHARWVTAMRQLYANLALETFQSIGLLGDGIENDEVVDVREIESGLQRAYDEGWIKREADVDSQEADVTHYRGIDDDGNLDASFYTRKARARLKRGDSVPKLPPESFGCLAS
ncbi:MAG TPA: hypothetical protein VG271_13425 [Beijerinckiaceae bacterium]|jgi:hypothetical protein|nr:hypothetical protein [Beijerinckiaceae bacterium]